MITKHLKAQTATKPRKDIAEDNSFGYNGRTTTGIPLVASFKDFWILEPGDTMKNIVDVQTGEVAINKTDALLRSSGIGSCIVIALLDLENRIGGLAHVMLPDRAPEKDKYTETRYAENAIETVLKKMLDAGAIRAHIISCIAGGANVLKRQDDTICEANIRSVTALLAEYRIPIKQKSIGGTERRRLLLDSNQGIVLCGIADEEDEIIFKINR